MNIQVFAHRGASLHAFENTQKAFEIAVRQNADGIEIDVQLTKDGQAVIFHDLDLRRLTGKAGQVNRLTLAELQRRKVGKRLRRFFGAPILTFHEVVAWANAQQMPLNIELKETFVGQVEAIHHLFSAITLPAGSHVSSFYIDVLAYVKHCRPDLETAYLVKKIFDWQSLAAYPFIDVVHAHKRLYKQENLEAAVAAEKLCRFYGIVGNEPFLQAPHDIVIGWIADDVTVVPRMQRPI